MSPTARRLWKIMPTGVWVDRDEFNKKFGPGFQLAITQLSTDRLIEFQWRRKDENGLVYANQRQFIRKRTIDEIYEAIADAINPRSKNFSRCMFQRLQVKCSLKSIQYANPFTYGGDGRKRKPDPRLIADWDDDW